MNILISIDNGFSSRYFIRSGFIERLLHQNICKVFLVLGNPDELQGRMFEFSDRIILLEQPLVATNSSLKGKICSYLEYIQKYGMPNDHDNSAISIKRNIFLRNRARRKWIRIILQMAIKLHQISEIFRKILKIVVCRLKDDEDYKRILRENKIDVVVLDGLSTLILRNSYWASASKKMRIKSITIFTNWDHPTSRGHMSVATNKYFVWGASMKKELMLYQDVLPKDIVQTGSIIFDFYSTPDFRGLIDEYLQTVRGKYVLFVTNSPYYPYNMQIIEFLMNNLLCGEMLFVRVHPLYLDKFAEQELIKMKELDRLTGEKVKFFFPISSSEYMTGDMDLTEMRLSASLVANCKLMINLFSTMVLDGLISNRPIINIAFDWEEHDPIPLTMSQAKHFVHIKRVLNTPCFYNVVNKDQLRSYLSGIHNIERIVCDDILIEQEVGRIDGKVQDRIIEGIVAHV